MALTFYRNWLRNLTLIEKTQRIVVERRKDKQLRRRQLNLEVESLQHDLKSTEWRPIDPSKAACLSVILSHARLQIQ